MKQGEKLLLLVRRDRRSTEEIAEAMSVDKSYLPRLYKLDKLTPKPLQKALEVFGVTREYFIGEAEGESMLNEGAGAYRSVDALEADFARLKEEITALRQEIARLNKMIEQEKGINKDLSEAILNMSKRG